MSEYIIILQGVNSQLEGYWRASILLQSSSAERQCSLWRKLAMLFRTPHILHQWNSLSQMLSFNVRRRKSLLYYCMQCQPSRGLITPVAGSEASLDTYSSAQTSHSTHTHTRSLSLSLCHGALPPDSVVWKAPCTILSLNMQEEKETK